MLALGEIARAAGNVLLTPTTLLAHPALTEGHRSLLIGAADRTLLDTVTQELRALAPHLDIDVYCDHLRGLSRVRQQRYDVVCVVLSGEPRRREKLIGVLSGAPLILARGSAGAWYHVHPPLWQPANPLWWARLFLGGLYLLCYLGIVEFALLGDWLQGFSSALPAHDDPGPVTQLRVTFIVPTYNQRALMDFCLPTLLAEAGNEHTVIVVDDAGTDDTTEYVRQTYPTVQVIKLERNRGFAGAVRAGIASSTTPLFALINNDAQVRPGFLRTMLPHFTRSEVFAVCSRIELADGTQTETGRVAAAFSGILEPYHIAPGEEPAPILYAGGASSLFHRARYEALGGLNTLYHPFYWEDIELGYRAWRAGWSSILEPRASVLHQRRATIGPRFGNDYAHQMFLKNALLFVLANIRDRALVSQHFAYVAARLILEAPAGNTMTRSAIFRALPSLPRALWQRWRSRRRDDRSDREILAQFNPQLEEERV